MDWAPYLKEWPGLLVALTTIVLLCKIIGKLLEFCFKLLGQFGEHRVVLSDMSGLLNRLCDRSKLEGPR
jgi:hypothetical protein